ncbi:glycosyltransferase family 4 protein [Butyrivibrio fibrisolvens]|nr:glycosyltransferase family 4 protein [Butyrivibrio fibrisolvens]
MHSNKNKSKLHIAMIGQKRVPSREGGVEVVVWELATRLRDKGHVVDCYNRYQKHKQPRHKVAGKPGLYVDDIRIIVVPTLNNGKLNAIVYAFFATIRALFGGYDVIHYHAEGPCLMLWLPKLFGKKVIATIHGLDWQRAKWGNFASKMLMTGEKIAAKYADEVIVLSKNVQEYFKETYGRDTHYIPNGISRPVIRKPNLITKKYGLKGHDYIMTLCRIVPEKGIHYLLEAYKNIDSDMKIVVAGGFSNAAEYMEQIRRMAAEDPRVILTDFIHDQELEELCSNAYIFCLPSDVEGMSISLLEGMSYGRCCLVSDIDENIEVVGDKAVSFKKSDVEDLGNKVGFLIDHPETVEKYENMAADYICDKYNWDKMTDATIELYNR